MSMSMPAGWVTIATVSAGVIMAMVSAVLVLAAYSASWTDTVWDELWLTFVTFERTIVLPLQPKHIRTRFITTKRRKVKRNFGVS